MSLKHAALAVFFCVGLLSVYAWAQTAQIPPPLLAPPTGVVSGNDIGFRVDRVEKGRAMGRLMVRVNGAWIEADVLGRAGMVPLKNEK